MKKIFLFLIALGITIFAQRPYLPGETVLAEDNLTWTDNNGYITTIFNEISINKRPVVIFWGGAG
jgi:hypothetical protein